LQNVASKVNAEDISFLPNSPDGAKYKLPKPKTVGGNPTKILPHAPLKIAKLPTDWLNAHVSRRKENCEHHI